MNKRFIYPVIVFLLVLGVISSSFNYNNTLFKKNKDFQSRPEYSDTCAANIPKAIGYVNDFEQVFTSIQISILDSIITGHEKLTSDEIAIVTLDSNQLDKCSLDDFSLKLAREWGVGKKEKNNGVVIAICTSLRKIRIQNGYGIEKIISNEELGFGQLVLTKTA